MRFNRGPRVVHVFPASGAPGVDEDLGELLHRDVILSRRPKIPAGAPRCRRIGEHRGGERQITGERLEHMLPRPHGCRIPHRHRLTGREVPHDVGDDPVGRPVAAANHVAGADGRQLNAMFAESAQRKEAPAVGGGHEFGRPLACTIGIMAAEPVSLIVRPAVSMGLVALVAGDGNQHAGLTGHAHRVEQRRRADDIDRKRLERLTVRKPHQRLRGQVQHHVWLGLPDSGCQTGRVADVGLMVGCHQIDESCGLEERGGRRGRERIASHAAPQPVE